MTNNRLLWLAMLLAQVATLCAQPATDTVPLTLDEASRLLMAHSPDILMGEACVSEAEGELTQSRAWENPEVTLLHNVNNPVTHRYLETGREGETDLQVSQRVFVGGQRSNAIRRNASLYASSREQLENTRQEQLMLLHQTMVALDGLYRKAGLYASQVEVLEKILSAYTEQQRKGNIASSEVLQIGSLLFAARCEQQANDSEMAERQAQLKTMLGLQEDVRPVVPDADKESIERLLHAEAQLADRPDIRSLSHNTEAAGHDVAWQRSNALPEVNLVAEWDKNGNIGRNFFAVGTTMTVPLFNRNRGTVASAKARQQQAATAYRQSLRQAEAEVGRLERQVRALLALTDAGDIEADLRNMMDHATQQYLKRNISLLEFSARMESYRSTLLSAIDNRTLLQQTITQLKKEKGLFYDAQKLP